MDQYILDAAKRSTWGSLKPVTRSPKNSKEYNRKKMQNWKKDLLRSASSFLLPFGLNFGILTKRERRRIHG